MSALDKKIVKIDPKLHHKIDMESARTQTPIYVLVERALDAYLSETPDPQASTTSTVNIKFGKSPIPFASTSASKYAAWHSKLEDILSSGIKDAIEAVTKNINVFHGYVAIRHRELAATREGKTQEPGRSEGPDSKHGQDLPKGTRRGA